MILALILISLMAWPLAWAKWKAQKMDRLLDARDVLIGAQGYLQWSRWSMASTKSRGYLLSEDEEAIALMADLSQRLLHEAAR
jgi:hypothetical protein